MYFLKLEKYFGVSPNSWVIAKSSLGGKMLPNISRYKNYFFMFNV